MNRDVNYEIKTKGTTIFPLGGIAVTLSLKLVIVGHHNFMFHCDQDPSGNWKLKSYFQVLLKFNVSKV
mgnify:CR=1 FL=1